jgi:hypothetical protein
MPFAYEVRIDCSDLGRRVTVRYRLPWGGFSDVIGVLETCDEATFGLRDRTGAFRVVERSEVVAAKIVDPPGRR